MLRSAKPRAAVLFFLAVLACAACSSSPQSGQISETPSFYRRLDPRFEGIYAVSGAGRPFMGTAWSVGGGLFVTACHVVAGESDLAVGGCKADLVAFDAIGDLALLHCPSLSGVAPAARRFDIEPILGQPVTATGFVGGIGPPGTATPVCTLGTVSGFLGAAVSKNDVPEAFLYDGGVHPGMSGSPVRTSDGSVIGIVSRAIPWSFAPNPTMCQVAPITNLRGMISSALARGLVPVPIPQPAEEE